MVYVFGALDVVTGPLTTRIVERGRAPGQGKPTTSGQRRVPEALARHLRDIAQAYPAVQYPRGVLVIDNAPWHQGAVITEVLTPWPHLEVSRLPSPSPQLQVIARFWRVLQRRATHNRLFTAVDALKQALRNSRCSDRPLRHQVLSVIHSPKKRTKLSTA